MEERTGSAFGQVLREKRIERKLSQEQLALGAGIDRTFVSLLESGLRQPTLKTLFALAKALRTSPSELIAAVEVRKPPLGNRGK